ncbi:BolA/IbaG family iron-sulfur metabolism protein [Halorubrum sp. Ea8]|uniref:BolA/IbaG family iron-sulfur metabolism protein n=1 Tax=Halorubrum sp. Ea8 TaxID=1383841 RepID=UPI000B98FEB9|nr:BolA family protein [Halorubrum sp. Ea8]OYR52544.1 BolA family transcriptional regulator [Halorubrum sp. Ea8]
MTIEPAEIEEIIEAGIPDAVARVTNPRIHDDEDEDAHFAAVVVSPAFEGESLVDQHQRVYDAVGDHMTRSVHALEIKTYTPADYAEHGSGSLAPELRDAGLFPVDEA